MSRHQWARATALRLPISPLHFIQIIKQADLMKSQGHTVLNSSSLAQVSCVLVTAKAQLAVSHAAAPRWVFNDKSVRLTFPWHICAGKDWVGVVDLGGELGVGAVWAEQ